MERMKLDRHITFLDENCYLILTSNSKEKEAVNSVVRHKRNLDIPIPNKGASIGIIEGIFVIHITGTSGVSDQFSISTLANRIIESDRLPNPKIILLVGFCWGNPAKCKVGDTILSSSIVSMNSQTAGKDGIKYNSSRHNSLLRLDGHRLGELANNNSLEIKVGELVSLEMLVMNTSIRDQIVQQYPSVLGGEMEAFALVPSVPNIPWLVLKTVSDTGCDNFNRDHQGMAANNSASLIPIIIPEINSSNDLDFTISGRICFSLLDEMIGKSIHIGRHLFNSDTLNDYLNDHVGPLIHRKLNQYASGVEYDDEFPYILCDLILEIAQNSFKHGGAKKVDITFNPKSISIIEDVKAFDIRKIGSGRGGYQAWENARSKYIESGDILYSVSGVSQTIELKKIDRLFREMINNCSANVIPNTVRSGFEDEVLSVNDSCNEIYVDVREIFMTSRRLDVVRDINKYLSEGKYVYISCGNEYEVQLYKELLTESLDRLRIFVGSHV